MRYDPDKKPDPKKWLKMGEDKRIEACKNYHVKANIEMPNVKMHAIVHSVVENQAATPDDDRVSDKLDQLQREGLSRHEAIHAVGLVMSEFLFDALTGNPDPHANENYFRELEQLDAAQWLAMAPEPGEFDDDDFEFDVDFDEAFDGAFDDFDEDDDADADDKKKATD